MAVVSEAVSAVALIVVLAVVGEPVAKHVRLFGVVFVAPLLLLRHYAKKKEMPVVTKTLIVTLFVTFVVYMYAVIKSGELTL